MVGIGRSVVVITGASSGVGRACAREFGRRGAHVALIARGQDGLEAAAREVKELGGDALTLSLDVADAEAVEAEAATIEEQFGAIDVWVNNAMLSVFSPVAELSPDEVRRVTEVTYLGYVHGTLSALGRMRPRDRGVIVQVESALSSATRSLPACSTATWLAPATTPSRRRGPSSASALTTSRTRYRATAAPMASSTPKRKPEACNSSPRLTAA